MSSHVASLDRETIKYYTLKETDVLPKGYELAGYEYRRFMLAREPEYLLWEIKTLEGDDPPVPLRGRFTSKERAKLAVDDFQDEEAKNKIT